VDTFEQRVQRPAGQEEQQRWYSGKKKGHTIKSQVAVEEETGRIVDVGDSVPGPTVASGMGHGPRRRLLQATQRVRCNRQAIASSLRTAAQRSWKRHRRSASETCSPTRLAWRKYWRCSSKPVQKRAAETKLPKPRIG